MEHEINILVVEPGKAPKPARVDYSLENLSQIVGGELAMGCFLPQRVMLLYNEDASRQGLPPNRCNPFVNECISGTFLTSFVIQKSLSLKCSPGFSPPPADPISRPFLVGKE